MWLAREIDTHYHHHHRINIYIHTCIISHRLLTIWVLCWIGWTRLTRQGTQQLYHSHNANPQYQCYFFFVGSLSLSSTSYTCFFLLLLWLYISVSFVSGSQLFHFMPIIHCLLKHNYYFLPILVTPLLLQVDTLSLSFFFPFLNFLSYFIHCKYFSLGCSNQKVQVFSAQGWILGIN